MRSDSQSFDMNKNPWQIIQAVWAAVDIQIIANTFIIQYDSLDSKVDSKIKSGHDLSLVCGQNL